MKLTGELAKKAAKVETKEELKKTIAEAGMELTDDELDQVAGGKYLQLEAVVDCYQRKALVSGEVTGVHLID